MNRVCICPKNLRDGAAMVELVLDRSPEVTEIVALGPHMVQFVDYMNSGEWKEGTRDIDRMWDFVQEKTLRYGGDDAIEELVQADLVVMAGIAVPPSELLIIFGRAVERKGENIDCIVTANIN